MWRCATDHRGPRPGGDARRATALVVVTLLISVLSVFALSAVSYSLSVLDSDRDATARVRALYLAELGRADAFAYVVKHPAATWPYSRGLTTVEDDQGTPRGEYSYTITDLTLPEQDPRRLVRVSAYWPSQANKQAEARLRVWMEEDGDWRIVAWEVEDSVVGGG